MVHSASDFVQMLVCSAEYNIISDIAAVVHKASGMLSVYTFFRYESAAISNVTVCRPGAL